MSVSSYDVGDIFTVRITKNLASNPDRKWVNSYEFQAITAGSEDELLLCGMACVNFEVQFHLQTVQFDRLLISTWTPDSIPYNPSAFITSSLSLGGLRTLGASQMMALHTCMDVRRVPLFGRFGHLFYRGCLLESDVEAPSGRNNLVNRLDLNTELQAEITAASLDDFVGTSAVNLQMVMVGKTEPTARFVAGLMVHGVAGVPVDHAWFNRTAPVGP